MTRWLGALLGLGCLFGGSADAQPYPARPITIVVTSAAGGLTDVMARVVGQRLGETWGQQVIIENRGGAGHSIGAAAVAKAPADGYTLMATEAGTFVTNPNLYGKGKLPYDAERDFAPIIGLVRLNVTLLAHPSLPVRNVAELIELAKQKPGTISYGTAGIGTTPHMSMVLIESMAGIKLVPVHYRGAAPALNDLIGGHINVISMAPTIALPSYRAGQIKMLAVGGARRLPQLAEVPTVAESGLPGYEYASWFGLFAPSGTPSEIVTKINAEVQRIFADPVFRDRFLSPQVLESMVSSPEEFADFVKSDTQKWGKVISDAKLRID
jgi:tripartite-type tricarboxylate transporter receptor subunit TctC